VESLLLFWAFKPVVVIKLAASRYDNNRVGFMSVDLGYETFEIEKGLAGQSRKQILYKENAEDGNKLFRLSIIR
jgi:hypothetical protein